MISRTEIIERLVIENESYDSLHATLKRVEEEARADAEAEALKKLDSAELVTVEALLESAQATAYTEVYAAFRRRAHVEGDRLEEALYTAPTLEQAMDKLIALAGFGPKEAVTLGLDKFGVGDLEDLYQALHRLTGDRFEISPYEQPPEPVDEK